jgi:hypothetical protein
LTKNRVPDATDAAAKAVRDPKFMEIADRQGFTVDSMPASEFHQWAVGIYEQARKVLTTAGEIK